MSATRSDTTTGAVPPEGDGRPIARTAPSRLPIWYFGFAHLCLATACAYLALQPELYFDSVYHPHAMVPVHLVTLGWITSSILGSLYLLAPMALRLRVRTSRLDGVGFAFFTLGVTGMVSHFWLYEYSGMVWSGLMVVIAVAGVGARVLPRLWRAPVAAGVRLCLVLAFANFFGAFLLGALAGLGKLGIAVPGHQLTTVWSHAHLAALGWATMMVFGVALRLLPMLLPAAMPQGSGPVVAALVFETGLLGLEAGLFFARRGLLAASAVVTVAGMALFLRQLNWMLRHPRKPAKGLNRPRLPMAQLAQALAYLGAAAVLGLSLVLFEPSPLLRARLMPIYGVCGLLGFLAQMVVGVSSRLLPLYAWQRAFAAGGFEPPPESPHELVDPRFRWFSFSCWTAALPLLIVGLAWQLTPAIEAAGLLLTSATLVAAIDGARMLIRASDCSQQ